jgi:hypothetical protein
LTSKKDDLPEHWLPNGARLPNSDWKISTANFARLVNRTLARTDRQRTVMPTKLRQRFIQKPKLSYFPQFQEEIKVKGPLQAFV